jgi:hypothetical protein
MNVARLPKIVRLIQAVKVTGSNELASFSVNLLYLNLVYKIRAENLIREMLPHFNMQSRDVPLKDVSKVNLFVQSTGAGAAGVRFASMIYLFVIFKALLCP